MVMIASAKELVRPALIWTNVKCKLTKQVIVMDEVHAGIKIVHHLTIYF